MLAGCVLLAAAPASAQDVASVYRGKTLTLIVSAGVGGGYDAYARPLSRSLSRHVPGEPSIVVQNMEGGGGLRAMNYLFNAAPKDGSVIALVHSTIPFAPLLGLEGASFDPTKVNWIASLNSEPQMCVARQGSKVQSFDDVFKTDFVVGSVGAGAGEELYPLAMNHLLGTRFKVINGYKSGNEILLAMERGEVDGRCALPVASLRSSRPDWITGGKVRFIVQTSVERSDDPVVADTPMVLDRTQEPEKRRAFELLFADQQASKPLLAPPGTPAHIVAALRKAVKGTMTDSQYAGELEKSRLSANFLSGEELEALVARNYASPPAVIDMARKAISKD
jgi:tripartite-type tricarboxylate transporter receptor subunit TctC